ncbi:PAS domain S-box protein [Trinickia sp. LjRoot230]|uniref:sensor histidine kinase n=1 Tax=Trinickia sp. LjRoot230 TaxID=3342288 RepID=UPI003ED1159D
MPAAAHSPAPDTPPRRKERAPAPLREPFIAAAVTAIIVFAITAAAVVFVRGRLIDSARDSFDARASHVTTDLRRELQLCTEVMRGASGFVAAQQATPHVPLTADGWDRYVAHLALEDTPPCVRTLGYAQVTTRGATSDTADIAPAEIAAIWPRRADGAAELRIGMQPETRNTLRHAADTGQIALVVHSPARPEESDATDSLRRTRVDMYVPVYRNAPVPIAPAEKRAALAGFVFAQLDVEYLFASVAARSPRLDMRVMAGTPAVALYPPAATLADLPDSFVSPPARFRRTDMLRFGGQLFRLGYGTNDPLLTESANLSNGVFLAAGFLAALVAGAAAFGFARRRDETLAEAGMARSLSSLNEARMMAIIRASSEAIITIDEAQRIVIFNPMAEQVFGCSAMDAIGGPLERFIPERYRKTHQKHVDQFGATGVTERQMGQQRVLTGLRANGEEFPMEASISQIADGDGRRKFYTVMMRDVTERVKAENELKASREELRELSANLQNVREEEKTRIARELHDDLGQQLTALKMDLSSVQQVLQSTDTVPAGVTMQLQSMRRLIDVTVGSVRRIAADLRPVMLDDLGLLPAIEWLLHDFTTRYGIEVERQIELSDVLFSRNGATTIFRIVQEALTNVVRHAQASHVSIELVVVGDTCRLRITDDGRGATPEVAEARGEKTFGLLGIRERAHILGGSVSIETAAKHGFTITVVLPMVGIQQEEALP